MDLQMPEMTDSKQQEFYQRGTWKTLLSRIPIICNGPELPIDTEKDVV